MNESMVIWYRKTEQEAKELVAQDPLFEFLGEGYNHNFPTLWAVKVYDKRNDPENKGFNRTVAQLVRVPH